MPTSTIGPFPLGIDNLSPDTPLPAGALLDAFNVVIDRIGQTLQRPGKRRLTTATGMHSLWHSRGTGMSLCVDNGALKRVRYQAGALSYSTVVAAVGDADMSYTDADGTVICSNGTGLWRVASTGASTASAVALTVPKPAATVTAAGGGGLAAGKYAVGVAFLTAEGEEGALSDIVFATVLANGGLSIAVAWPNPLGRVVAARVYRSPPNDPVLYRAADIAAGMSSSTIGAGTLGRQTETAYLRPMPPGSIVRYWRGRLLVASGSVLWFSEPMRYGVNHPADGFVAFGSTIAIVQPVFDGVFVGNAEGVMFLSGNKPDEWSYVRTGGGLPFPGTGGEIPANEFGGDIGNTGLPLAVWLSDQGLSIGMPGGKVVEPQSGSVNLSLTARGVLGWFKRRFWASV